MLRRFWGILIIIACLGVTTMHAYAAIDENSAKKIAEKFVPEDSSYLSTKSEDDEYEVKFFHAGTEVFYEIEINKITEKVQEVKTKVKNKQGGKVVKLAKDDVCVIILREFPTATVTEIELEAAGKYKIYEAKFRTREVKGEMSINPETGAILERELCYLN